jgi:hypothetical protein
MSWLGVMDHGILYMLYNDVSCYHAILCLIAIPCCAMYALAIVYTLIDDSSEWYCVLCWRGRGVCGGAFCLVLGSGFFWRAGEREGVCVLFSHSLSLCVCVCVCMCVYIRIPAEARRDSHATL